MVLFYIHASQTLQDLGTIDKPKGPNVIAKRLGSGLSNVSILELVLNRACRKGKHYLCRWCFEVFVTNTQWIKCYDVISFPMTSLFRAVEIRRK